MSPEVLICTPFKIQRDVVEKIETRRYRGHKVDNRLSNVCWQRWGFQSSSCTFDSFHFGDTYDVDSGASPLLGGAAFPRMDYRFFRVFCAEDDRDASWVDD